VGEKWGVHCDPFLKGQPRHLDCNRGRMEKILLSEDRANPKSQVYSRAETREDNYTLKKKNMWFGRLAKKGELKGEQKWAKETKRSPESGPGTRTGIKVPRLNK